MRIQHRYLLWDSHTEVIDPIKNMLDAYAIPYNFEANHDSAISNFKYQLAFYLFEDDVNFKHLKHTMGAYDMLSQVSTLYEKKDIENANWFIINPKPFQYPQPENNFNYLKATFELNNYCSVCGIGKIQNAPFRLKSVPKSSSNQFLGLHWVFDAIFVKPEVAQLFIQENIKGISFTHPVLHKSNIEADTILQLHIKTTLEKGFDPYNSKTITCKIKNEENCNHDENLNYCNRIKYHHPMIGGYLFDMHIFDPGFEIVQSHEYFGSGASASKLLIVSKRIKNLIENLKLKGLSFTPIVHEKFNR